MKFPKVGVGVLVIHEGKILLGKRKGSFGAGTWALAGGHLEYGEEVEACAKRELLEETGLEALYIEKGPWTNNIIEGLHYLTVFMIVSKFTGRLKVCEPDKCEEWKWFAPDNLPKPLFTPAESLLRKLILEKTFPIFSVNYQAE